MQRDFPGYGYRRMTRELGLVPIGPIARAAHMQAMLLPQSARHRPWLVAEPDAVSGSWYPISGRPSLQRAESTLGVRHYLRAVGTDLRVPGGRADVFSRKVISYAIGPTLDADCPWPRWTPPSRAGSTAGLHSSSDGGSQYSSKRYERLARRPAGLHVTGGNPYDNAVEAS